MSIELRTLERSDLGAARELLEAACEFDAAAQVAEEKIFGAAPGVIKSDAYGAFSGSDLAGVSVASDQWLRLLAVHPDVRGQGLGTVLLAAAESAIITNGAEVVRTLDQPGNYLAPGIDARNTDLLGWLTRCGYYRGATNTNLLIDVVDNDRVSRARADEAASRAEDAGYRVRRAAVDDIAELADRIGRTFSTTWAFEVERAVRHRPSGVHIAEQRSSGALAAFAAHDGNNRGLGWFGPAGTFAEHRRKGLGEALLLACLVDVAEAGHEQCTVAWIGPRDFYDRVAGIREERTYVVMKKELAVQ